MHFFCVQEIQVSSDETGAPQFEAPQYIVASRQKVHQTKTKAVEKIIVLPQISRALVLSNHTVSVFSVPEFAPASGFGKVRDVLDMCVDDNTASGAAVQVTTFTKNTIRVVNVSANGLKLVKDVTYAEAVTGVRRGRLCLVGNSKAYDLVDIDRVRKVPLFPVFNEDAQDAQDSLGTEDGAAKSNPLPIAATVGSSEFLVACGTRRGDPAMGMVINSDGDISRGTIPWNDYPSSVVVDYPNVGAVVGDKLYFHSCTNQALLHEAEATKTTVATVLKQFVTPYPQLVDKLRLVELGGDQKEEETKDEAELGDKKSIEKWCVTKSNIFSFSPAGISAFISTPRLFYLETLIERQRLGELQEEMDKMDKKDESSTRQKSYIRLLSSLSHLAHDRQSDLLDLWTSGYDGTLDLRIIVYVFFPALVRGLWVPKGVIPALEVSASAASLPGMTEVFAKICEYHLGRKQCNHRAVLEVAYCQLLLNADQQQKDDPVIPRLNPIYRFINEQLTTEAGMEESAKLLEAAKKRYALSLLDLKRGKTAEVCHAWQKILNEEWEEPDFENGSQRLANLLKECSDKDIVRAYGLWLVDKFPEEGIQIFVDAKTKIRFDSKEDKKRISTAIKSMENQKAWKAYLHEMLFVQHDYSMRADYISLLVDESIDRLAKDPGEERVLQQLADDYRELGTPKRSFEDFLRSKKDQSELLSNRFQIISLIKAKDTNLTPENYLELRERLEQIESLFVLELVIVYGHLGDHRKCIETLVHTIADYQTAIEYCANVGYPDGSGSAKATDATAAAAVTTAAAPDLSLRADLFPILFTQLLKIENEEAKIHYCRQVLEQYGGCLETKFVLNSVPATWPIEILNGYLVMVLRRLTTDKNKSLMLKSLTRSENLSMSDQLTTLTRLEAEVRSE